MADARLFSATGNQSDYFKYALQHQYDFIDAEAKKIMEEYNATIPKLVGNLNCTYSDSIVKEAIAKVSTFVNSVEGHMKAINVYQNDPVSSIKTLITSIENIYITNKEKSQYLNALIIQLNQFESSLMGVVAATKTYLCDQAREKMNAKTKENITVAKTPKAKCCSIM